MIRKLALTGIGFALLLSPIVASAQSTDIQTQIAALQAQVKLLLARIAQLQGQTTRTDCVNLSSNLTLGSTGTDVTNLQNYLIKKGYLNAEYSTGYYGFLTAQAVGKLQLSLGIVSSASDTAYGLMGPKTRAAIGCGISTLPPKPITTPSIKVDVDGSTFLTVAYYNLPAESRLFLVDANNINLNTDINNRTAVSGTGGIEYDAKAMEPGYYYVEAMVHTTTDLSVARSNTFHLGSSDVGTGVVTEQVKCVFTGATTEQKCWGDAPSRTVGEPTHYGCTGVGTCVMTVSGPKGTPITWGSSCGGSADTVVGGGNKYAYFSCSTIKVSANAGDNRTITLPTSSVTPINHSASSPETGVLTYKWTNVERTVGTAVPTIINGSTLTPTFSGLTTAGEYSTIGQYTFRLTVTDNSGHTATDDMVVTVNPPVYDAPTANAGSDINITLPTSSVTPINQSASSPETGVLTYKWTNVERTMGTAVPVITNGTTLAPTFSGLTTGGEYSTIGQYTFRLTVTDSHGQTATDDMVVTVNP